MYAVSKSIEVVAIIVECGIAVMLNSQPLRRAKAWVAISVLRVFAFTVVKNERVTIDKVLP